MAKRLCSRLAMSIQAAALFLDISSNFRRATGGRFGDDRMRLMTIAVGPAILSKLSNAQAVLRPTPRTSACLAVVSHPAAINTWRISASFEACLAFARLFLVCRNVHPPHKLAALCSQKSPTSPSSVGLQGPAFRRRIAQRRHARTAAGQDF